GRSVSSICRASNMRSFFPRSSLCSFQLRWPKRPITGSEAALLSRSLRVIAPLFAFFSGLSVTLFSPVGQLLVHSLPAWLASDDKIEAMGQVKAVKAIRLGDDGQIASVRAQHMVAQRAGGGRQA